MRCTLGAEIKWLDDGHGGKENLCVVHKVCGTAGPGFFLILEYPLWGRWVGRLDPPLIRRTPHIARRSRKFFLGGVLKEMAYKWLFLGALPPRVPKKKSGPWQRQAPTPRA